MKTIYTNSKRHITRASRLFVMTTLLMVACAGTVTEAATRENAKAVRQVQPGGSAASVPALSEDDINRYAGIGEGRDGEQIYFSQVLIRQVQREGGVVKVSRWTWKRHTMYYAQRYDSPETGWQGPNSPSGYHTRPREYGIYEYAPGSSNGDPKRLEAAPRLAKAGKVLKYHPRKRFLGLI